MNLLNRYILDKTIGNYKQAELPLMHQNLENKDLIPPQKSIIILDRGYNTLELYRHIMSMNCYFIIRLKDKNYMDDRYKITRNNAIIELELTKERLKKFHNRDLKEKYLKLRILTIILENKTTEYLLTNILNKNFTIEDFKELYNLHWKSKPTTI